MGLTPDQQTELAELEAEFTATGGRGVDLADRIDTLRNLARSPLHTTVDVTVADMLTFGHDYEFFVDLLRDRAIAALDLDDTWAGWRVTDHHAVTVPAVDVIRFDVDLTYDP